MLCTCKELSMSTQFGVGVRVLLAVAIAGTLSCSKDDSGTGATVEPVQLSG
jgi:hypothetical protein